MSSTFFKPECSSSGRLTEEELSGSKRVEGIKSENFIEQALKIKILL